MDEKQETETQAKEDAMEKPTHAHFSLSRLGGCNYKIPVTYQKKSVWVRDPQETELRIYRLNAAKFLAGDFQIRDSWAIRKWDERAERTMEAEKNWQT